MLAKGTKKVRSHTRQKNILKVGGIEVKDHGLNLQKLGLILEKNLKEGNGDK